MTPTHIDQVKLREIVYILEYCHYRLLALRICGPIDFLSGFKQTPLSREQEISCAPRRQITLCCVYLEKD